MTTWLVRIRPDLRDAKARFELTDAVRLHQRLMTLVPDGLGDRARQQAGLLYRIDTDRGGAVVLAQTCVKPEIARLPADYGQVEVRDIDDLLSALAPGQQVAYRLVANAAKRSNEGATKGKVIPLVGPQIEEWWASRAERCGLRLHTLSATGQPGAFGTRQPTVPAEKPHRIRHALTRFDGTSTVADPDLLRTAIHTGVGRGKSHGAGLLSVAVLSGGTR